MDSRLKELTASIEKYAVGRDGIAQVAIGSETVAAALRGDNYQGNAQLKLAGCNQAQVLAAVALPAVLVYSSNVNLRKLGVTCVSGCLSKRERLASSFKKVPAPSDGSTNWTITLEFKAEDFRSKTEQFSLVPGRNPISAELQPL